jgi:uncharacterized protein
LTNLQVDRYAGFIPDPEARMLFNVASLLKEITGTLREDDIDDDVAIDGETHHLTGHVRFDRTNDGILVRARLHGQTSDACARCLRPVDYPVDIVIEEEYLPTVDVVTGAPLDPAEVEVDAIRADAYRIDKRHMIDLTEPIEQYWAMALPMAPVCREDCPGLCPSCGQEQDAAGHTCAPDDGDSRWAKLRNLQLG